MAEDPDGPALARQLARLRELLDPVQYPEAIPALVRHLDHRRTREGTGEKLAAAAWLLAYTLDRIVTDTGPHRPVPLLRTDQPVPRAPYCQECAADADKDEHSEGARA